MIKSGFVVADGSQSATYLRAGMWAQTEPLTVELVGGGSDWWRDWLPIATAIVVLVGGAVVQFVVQRREFGDRELQWRRQQGDQLQRWSEEQAFEREKQLRPERIRTLASFLVALEDALTVGVETAARRASPNDQRPSVEHLTGLLEQLGGRAVPVRVDRDWTDARQVARRAGAEAALLASDELRRAILDALSTLGISNPAEDVEEWLPDPSILSAGARAFELQDKRNEVERLARHDLGIAEVPPQRPS